MEYLHKIVWLFMFIYTFANLWHDTIAAIQFARNDEKAPSMWMWIVNFTATFGPIGLLQIGWPL